MFNLDFFVDPDWWVPLYVQRPAKAIPFQQIIMHACIAMPTWPKCAPPILCWPWPPYILLPRSCLSWIFSSILTDGTTLRAAPSKSYAFSTNYHACIAMPTWPRCAPPILCWPWPPYDLLLRSCLTWIFSSILTDGYHFACSAQPFQQIIVHALQCQHDLDVHLLFCVDLDLHITSSRGRV